MEQMLRQARMVSAAARRRKAREREAAARETEERKLRILLYGYSSDEEDLSDDEDNHHTYSPILDIDTDLASPTEAAYHQTTFIEPRIIPQIAYTPSSPPNVYPRSSSLSPYIQPNPAAKDIQEVVPPTPTSFRLLVHPTLQSPSDFTFDTYQRYESSDTDDSSPPSPSSELDSPIEIATPISYSLPRHPPSMISIPRSYRSSGSSTSDLPRPRPRQRSLSPPPRSEHRLSNSTIRSGYPACEATPFEIPNPDPTSAKHENHNAIRMRAFASAVTLPLTLEAPQPDLPPRTRPNLRSPRLSSLKKFMLHPLATEIDPSACTASATKTANSYTDDRISTGSLSTMSSSRDSQSPIYRPRTATMSSTTSWGTQGVTALPTADADENTSCEDLSQTTLSSPQVQPGVGMRKRRTTMGKAIKSASSSIRTKGRLSLRPSLSGYFDEFSKSRKSSPEREINLSSFEIPASPAGSTKSSMYLRESSALSSVWKRPGMKSRVFTS